MIRRLFTRVTHSQIKLASRNIHFYSKEIYTGVSNIQISGGAAGDVNIKSTTFVPGMIFFNRGQIAGQNFIGFSWMPGFWQRSKIESQETNRAIVSAVRNLTITPYDLVRFVSYGLIGGCIFKLGEVIGRGKISGYHDQLPHHGRGHYDPKKLHEMDL